ncbi:hypothetical protein [Lactococcus lactis]|uniref:hypothetical protein n=1 Tax=Lactococcus lactis TaxID=1358 RepID=UPI0022E68197|nr:hypothetical protein [Lactococcus lactis]
MSDKKCPICGYELDSWNDCVSFNNILECPECEEHFELKAVTLNQPSLTIPKSIAEQADKIAYYALQKEGAEEFHQWFDYKQDEYMDVVFAYLNPLTRDLVKVVEG